MTFITGVHSKDVPQTWPQVAKFIHSGLMDGGGIEELLARVMRRECALWVAKDREYIVAACVTENVILDGRKICNVISVGGVGMDDWLKDLGMIEAWSISNGCAAMRFEDAREGWLRILSSHGYVLISKNPQTKLITLEKVL